jgi:hypothetical protein
MKVQTVKFELSAARQRRQLIVEKDPRKVSVNFSRRPHGCIRRKMSEKYRDSWKSVNSVVFPSQGPCRFTTWQKRPTEHLDGNENKNTRRCITEK